AAEAAAGGAVATSPAPSLPGVMRGRFGSGRAAGSKAAEVADKLDAIQQETRWVNGKAFAQSGTNWTDTSVQAQANAKRNRVQFASKEYFDLLTNKPESAQWLALGKNVQFTLGSELYDVYE